MQVASRSHLSYRGERWGNFGYLEAELELHIFLSSRRNHQSLNLPLIVYQFASRGLELLSGLTAKTLDDFEARQVYAVCRMDAGPGVQAALNLQELWFFGLRQRM